MPYSRGVARVFILDTKLFASKAVGYACAALLLYSLNKKQAATQTAQVRWSKLGAQKQDVYSLSHDRKKEQDHAG